MAELTGKVIAVLPLANGVSSKTGKEWASQEYVIEEQNARYPQRVCFEVFGSEKIQQFALQLGDVVTAKFELGAREYNGRWYNKISCWGVERSLAAQPAQQTTQQVQQQPYTQSPQPQPQGYAPQPQDPYPPQGGGYYQAQPQDSELPF